MSIVLAGLLPDFMTPEGTTLIYAIVVFFLMLGLLWKFAWGPIMHALEEREKKIQGTIDDATNKLKEAEARVAEYNRKLDLAKDDAAKIIAEGKRDVDVLVAEEKAKARAEIEADRDRAKKEISLAKDAAVAELRDRVVALTGDIASKVIRREVKPEDHRAFIAQSLDEIDANRN